MVGVQHAHSEFALFQLIRRADGVRRRNEGLARFVFQGRGPGDVAVSVRIGERMDDRFRDHPGA